MNKIAKIQVSPAARWFRIQPEYFAESIDAFELVGYPLSERERRLLKYAPILAAYEGDSKTRRRIAKQIAELECYGPVGDDVCFDFRSGEVRVGDETARGYVEDEEPGNE